MAIITGTRLGTALTAVLMCDTIEPGTSPSYEICKILYEFHPLGAKMAESPIRMAQSQGREITVSKGPEGRVKEAFEKQWKLDRADNNIFNVAVLARVYGLSSIALVQKDVPSSDVLDFKSLANEEITFNVFDPLNSSGSSVLSQDPNSPNFLKQMGIIVQGQSYHPSRTCVLMNGNPIYIGYVSSAFGYTGRSVYQRALFPLKSFVNTMITDDMVTRKAGVIIAKMKQVGSIVNNLIAKIAGEKRNLLKEAETNNVMSIDITEAVESLNLQNLEGPYKLARTHILENAALCADMPAKLLNQETFAEGFGEGTEDAKNIARFVDTVRRDLDPVYQFFDRIIQYRAWTPEFYKTIQDEFPEYKKKKYEEAFYEWSNSFEAVWPNLLTEPPSEKVKVDDSKLKGVTSLLEILMPQMDPENKINLIRWASDNFNELKEMFSSPLILDYDALESYTPPEPPPEATEPKPESLEGPE